MQMTEIPGYFDYPGLYNRVVRQAPPGSLLVEVGVYHGRSLCHLAMVARSARKGLRVVGVDWCRPLEHPDGRAESALADKIHGNLMRFGLADDASLIIADSVRGAALLSDAAAWFVFIDASHDTESVIRDVTAWWPKVAPGGIMAGHDVDDPRVSEAVRYCFGDRWRVAPETPDTCWEIRKEG